MKKETFVAILNTLKDAKQRNEEISADIENLWRKHRPMHIDFCKDSGVVFDDWELYDNMTSAVANEFTYPNAEDDLNWWFYEVPLHQDNAKDACIYINDVGHDVSSADALYDFMEEQERLYKSKQE